VLAVLSSTDCHDTIFGSESRVQALYTLQQLGSTAAQYPYAVPVLLRATLVASLFWGDGSRSGSASGKSAQNSRQRKLIREALETADNAMAAVLHACPALPSSTIAMTIRAAAAELLAQRSSCPDSAARRLVRWAFSLTELSLPPPSSPRNTGERPSCSTSTINCGGICPSGTGFGSLSSHDSPLHVRCSAASVWLEVGQLAVAWEERAASSDVFTSGSSLQQTNTSHGRSNRGLLAGHASQAHVKTSGAWPTPPPPGSNGGGLRAWRLCDCVVVEVAAAIKRARVASEPSLARAALWRGLEACARQTLGLDIRGSTGSAFGSGNDLINGTAATAPGAVGHIRNNTPRTIPASLQAWHLLLAHACVPQTEPIESGAAAVAAPGPGKTVQGEDVDDEPGSESEAEAMLQRLASLEVKAATAAVVAAAAAVSAHGAVEMNGVTPTAPGSNDTVSDSKINSSRNSSTQQRQQLPCVWWYLNFASSFADPNHPALVRALRWLLNCAMALGPNPRSNAKSEGINGSSSCTCNSLVEIGNSKATPDISRRSGPAQRGSGSANMIPRECPSVRRVLLTAVEIAIQRRADRFAQQQATCRPQFAAGVGGGIGNDNTGCHVWAEVMERSPSRPSQPPPLPWLPAALSEARCPYEHADDDVDPDDNVHGIGDYQEEDDGDSSKDSACSFSLAPLVGYRHLVQVLVPGSLPATAALLYSVRSAMSFRPPAPVIEANGSGELATKSELDDDVVKKRALKDEDFQTVIPPKRLRYAGQDLGKLKLPDDCALLVVQYLHPKRLCKLSLASSMWHAAASRPALWQHHFYRRWGVLPVRPTTTIRRRGPQPGAKANTTLDAATATTTASSPSSAAAPRPASKHLSSKTATLEEEEDAVAHQHDWRALFVARAVAEKAIAGCTSNSGWRWRLCKQSGDCNAVLKSPLLRTRHAAKHALEDARHADRVAKAAAKVKAKEKAKAAKEEAKALSEATAKPRS